MAKLPIQQERFVAEYLTDFNATQAAIRAGYSAISAHVIGHRLLNKDKVQAEIEAKKAASLSRLAINEGWVLERLSMEAKGEGPDTSPAARVQATQLLGKHLGMFRETLAQQEVHVSLVIER